MAKRKPRLGRPPLPRDIAAVERVELRLTTAVRITWQAAAEREGLSLSEWLRAAAELAIARGSTSDVAKGRRWQSYTSAAAVADAPVEGVDVE